MSAMRFTNVAVPRSAVITDVRLKISSISEGFRGQVYGLIEAESADNAADFSSRYIAAAAKTAAAVNWDHKFAWDKNTWQISPDISSVIQEIVNRSGWDSGNSAVVFYSTRADSGKSRMFGSFEAGAGFAAVLEVTYETYSISGYITTADGGGVDGVTISAGADIEGTVTDATGYYELLVPPGWSGTVTPSKFDWGFTPASRTYSNVPGDQTNQDYIAFQPKISGYITDSSGASVEGVAVSANNSGGSDTTGPNGYYEITVPYNWSGTVTPAKSGWAFTPQSQTYSNVTTNQLNQNYTAFQPVISGYVKDSSGAGVEGVAVSANNSGGSDTTGLNGYYEITVQYNWSGTVTPNKTGWGFTPASRTYSNVTTDQLNQNYTAFQPKISGYVRDANSIGVGGVLVSANNGGGSDTTNAGGYYEIIVPYNWSGTVTPDKTGWLFNPLERSYGSVTANQLGQNYIARLNSYASGDGTAEDPFLIYTAEQMNAIGVNPGDWDKYFKLMADIDLGSYTGVEFNIIGYYVSWSDNQPFTGVFDGNGHTISNFTYNLTGTNYTGLFRYVFGNNAGIKNLTLIDPNVSAGTGYYVGSLVGVLNNGTITDCNSVGGSVSGYRYVGGLVGQNSHGMVSSSYAAGSVSGSNYVGGLVGYNYYGTVSNSYAAGSVSGLYYVGGLVGYNEKGDVFNSYATSSVSWYYYVGGLMGQNYQGTVSNSYATGSVSGIYAVGGLVGQNYQGTVSNSYTTGGVSGNYNVGGLVGSNNSSTVSNSYASGSISGSSGVGGLVGYNWSGSYTSSLWDNTVNPDINGIGNGSDPDVIGQSTENMQTESTFTSAGWDFSTPVWKICDGVCYPVLWWQEGAILGVSPLELQVSAVFEGPSLLSEDLSVGNCNTGSIEWEIVETCQWLDVSANSGSLTAYQSSDVNVIIDITGLPPGTYDCALVVSDPNAANSPRTVEVHLEVLGPVISVEPNNLAFQASKDNPSPPDQTIFVQNAGYATLNWQIIASNDCNWLNVYPATGKSSGDVNEATLSVNTVGLDYGYYSCQLTVNDPNATNSPQIVSVQLDVLGPVMSVMPGNLDFEAEKDGADPNVQILSIQNTGYDTLNWQIDIPADCGWLSANPMSAQSTGEIDEVTLSVDANGLDVGFYNCELTVSAPDAENSPQTVQVSLHVYTPGQIHVPAEYSTIQAAIDAAVDGDEVILEPGTYTGPGNYNIDFTGKAITVRSVEPNNPAIVAATIIEPNTFATGFDFHSEEQADSVVDGLTIRRCFGWAAIDCYNSSPTIRNCIIEDNYGSPWSEGGAGIACYGSSAVISNCIVRDNIGGFEGGSGINIWGGQLGGSVTIRNCLISNNQAFGGGGISCFAQDVHIINCTIVNNWSLRYPWNPQGETIGGGILLGNSNVTIRNSIFWNNDANEGAQIAIYDEYGEYPSTVTVSYSDVQGGQGEVFVDPNCTLNWELGNIDIDPCFAEPGYWDANGTPADTNDDLWIDGDYHLKSQAGRWDPNTYKNFDLFGDGFTNLLDFAAFAGFWQKEGEFIPADLDNSGIVDSSDLAILWDNYLRSYSPGAWVFDDVTSPCIDAGDPNSDWTAELWPHGKRINMGVFGGTTQASMSLSSLGNIADLNNDDIVDVQDLTLLVDMWLTEDVLLAEDIDRNGLVNFSDFAEFVRNWLWEQ